MENRVICISRRYGSCGNLVAERLADELGITYLGKNLLDMAIEHGNLEQSQNIKKYKEAEEKAPNLIFYKVFNEGNENVEKKSPASDIIHNLEKQIILEKAKQGDLVVVGHCGGEIMKEAGIPALNVFITADYDYRFDYMQKETELKPAQIAKQLDHIDNKRKEYFRNYTGKEWSDPENYDLILNVGAIGIDRAVNMLEALYLTL